MDDRESFAALGIAAPLCEGVETLVESECAKNLAEAREQKAFWLFCGSIDHVAAKRPKQW